MGKINVLDCTLRDGGYVNDWAFGKDAIDGMLKKFSLANIECVEVGFLRPVPYNENRSLFPDMSSLDALLKNKNRKMKYFVMYDVSNPLDIDSFKKNDGNGIDGVRVIFKKDRINDGIKAVKKFMELGYLVAGNFVSTNFYSDKEFIDGIKTFNDIKLGSLKNINDNGEGALYFLEFPDNRKYNIAPPPLSLKLLKYLIIILKIIN